MIRSVNHELLPPTEEQLREADRMAALGADFPSVTGALVRRLRTQKEPPPQPTEEQLREADRMAALEDVAEFVYAQTDQSTVMQGLVREAIAGDRGALHELLELITPAVKASISHAVRRQLPSALRRSASDEVEALTRDILLKLFADQGKRLLLWDPGEGLPLVRYVELRSRPIAVSVLRSRQRTPWSIARDLARGLLHVGRSDD
jgi:hypothetical protein